MTQNQYRRGLKKFIKDEVRLNKEQRRIVVDLLRKANCEIGKAFPSLIRLSLVGSIVKGGFSKNSDVDIVARGLKKEDYFRFKSYIESKLKRSVDLIMEEDLDKKDRAHLLSKQEIAYDFEEKGS